MFLSEPAASWFLAAQRCSMKSTCSEVFQWVVSLTSSSLCPWHQSSRAGCGGACTVLLHRSVPSITYVFDWSARFFLLMIQHCCSCSFSLVELYLRRTISCDQIYQMPTAHSSMFVSTGVGLGWVLCWDCEVSDAVLFEDLDSEGLFVTLGILRIAKNLCVFW